MVDTIVFRHSLLLTVTGAICLCNPASSSFGGWETSFLARLVFKYIPCPIDFDSALHARGAEPTKVTASSSSSYLSPLRSLLPVRTTVTQKDREGGSTKVLDPKNVQVPQQSTPRTRRRQLRRQVLLNIKSHHQSVPLCFPWRTRRGMSSSVRTQESSAGSPRHVPVGSLRNHAACSRPGAYHPVHNSDD